MLSWGLSKGVNGIQLFRGSLKWQCRYLGVSKS